MAVDKAGLRRDCRGPRGMSDSERAAGRLIRDHVLEMPEVAAAGTVAAYYSVGTEPDTHGLIFALWKRGSYVVLPVLLPDGDLDWASYEGPDSLAPGPRGAAAAGGAGARDRHGRAGGRGPGAGPGRRRARHAARPWRRVATTGRWPGWAGRCRRSRCCTTANWCHACPRKPHDRAVRAVAQARRTGITWLPALRQACGISGPRARLSLAVC